ncbi:MAG: V-type ATP synthase subunit F [Anaerolineae bacterium]
MAKLMVITDPTLAPGFRLAGVEVFAASTAGEAKEILLSLIDEGEAGVIAVHAGYLAGLDEATRRRVEEGYRPVVIGIPTGRLVAPEERRSRHIAELIRRAIGFRITFREEAEEERG